MIQAHSKVIGQFVDTHESKFGQIALKRLFEAADRDGNGTLDREEIAEALLCVPAPPHPAARIARPADTLAGRT